MIHNNNNKGVSYLEIKKCDIHLIGQKFYLIKDGKKEVKEIEEVGVHTFAWDDNYSYKAKLKENPCILDQIKLILNLD